MSASSSSPPSLAVVDGGGGLFTSTAHTSSSLSSAASDSSSSIMIVTIIISSAVIISASVYLLLRLISKRFRRTFSTADDVVLRQVVQVSNHPQCHVALNDLLDSLPLFSFRSVTRNLNGGDCAVCLSKFDPHDQLRLLPLCCHAFHADCIDKWIVSNQTCPLCRSTVISSGSDVLHKILSAENRGNLNSFRDGNQNSGSFRIELGSVSPRRGGAAEEGGTRRSYSLGSYEYIVDDCVYEVSAGCTTLRRGFSDLTSNEKGSTVGIPEPEPVAEVLAVDGSGRRNWLREYVDRVASLSSRTMSFRSSARFFSGSSRRSEAVVVPEDLEANRVGEEISELFHWLSRI